VAALASVAFLGLARSGRNTAPGVKDSVFLNTALKDGLVFTDKIRTGGKHVVMKENV
jgi:hypothetical protein